ncbi:hypothetical protein E9677_17925 [Rhizobium rhizophilum]|uniref:Secreted protein n=1 Tax=Rhizobium rhizophilum TaxID=1850373 RepID=A0ABY2QRH0_9HYPH|nr:hypothetical protein E9677_17925 [Rhizobium rhizophilum]
MHCFAAFFAGVSFARKPFRSAPDASPGLPECNSTRRLGAPLIFSTMMAVSPHVHHAEGSTSRWKTKIF